MPPDFLPTLTSLFSAELTPGSMSLDATTLPGELFHYTSAEACFSILEARLPANKPELWTSSAFCMNDSSEIEHGLDLCRRIGYDYFPQHEVEKYLARDPVTNEFDAMNTFSQVFVACFCAV